MTKKVQQFKKVLKEGRAFVLDGAMGTEISSRGTKTTLPLWSAQVILDNPNLVKEIHRDYIKNGASIIVTNTFRTTKRTFRKVGLEDKARGVTILACKLAKEAVELEDENVLIAGSMAPLEDCYSPELVPLEKELKKEHLEYAQNLKKGGVDFLFLETMISLREINAGLEAAKKVMLPVAVSLCCNDKGELLSGESLEEVVKLVSKYDPLFIALNCMNIKTITKLMKKLKKLTNLPIGAYGQGDGEPDDDEGWRFTRDKGVKIYLNEAKNWLKDGVQVIGGCCGTNPEYIKRLSTLIPRR